MDYHTFNARQHRELKHVIPNFAERAKEISKRWKMYKESNRAGASGAGLTVPDDYDEDVDQMMRLLGVSPSEPEPQGRALTRQQTAQEMLTEAQLNQARNYESRFAKPSDGSGSMLRALGARMAADPYIRARENSIIDQGNQIRGVSGTTGRIGGSIFSDIAEEVPRLLGGAASTGEILANPPIGGASPAPVAYNNAHTEKLDPELYGGGITDFLFPAFHAILPALI